jgi:hypothetical protein
VRTHAVTEESIEPNALPLILSVECRRDECRYIRVEVKVFGAISKFFGFCDSFWVPHDLEFTLADGSLRNSKNAMEEWNHPTEIENEN